MPTGARSTAKRNIRKRSCANYRQLGWLAALIPEEYGGTGLGITEASIILEEINHSGGVATACHAQMYTMGTLLAPRQRGAKKTLPAENRHRRAAPASLRRHRTQRRLGEHAHPDQRRHARATNISSTAQKIFISRVLQSDLMLLLARTTPYDELKDKTRGLSVFIVDLREANKENLKLNRSI